MSVRKFLSAAVLGASAFAFVSGAHASTVIANGSFESPTTAASPNSSGSYAYPGVTIDSWTYMGDAGLIDAVNGTPWFGGTPPQGYDGAQYAFVQVTGSISQSFTTGAGLFRASWLEASRPALCCGGNQTYNVTLDNVVLDSFTTHSGQQFQSRSVLGPVVTGGQHTLAFVGLNPLGGDNTAFIDNVSAGVPEPAAWGLMIMGLGGIGAVARRRRAVAFA